jgi:mono/diheme cytochrome c family protein
MNQPNRVSRFLSLAAHPALIVLLAPLATAQDEPERDGKWLYTRHCAGCHNDNGDGKGPTITALGQAARDFKAGGFAFGDSREQIFKTLSSGIPGRSPMPSFAGAMTDEERWKVVDYVRTLMPPRKDEAPSRTLMVVADKALTARGKLPPIADGARETARGLLLGTPSGVTFEYDVADVRLLGVRLGAFADREDWGDRGGGYLRPLGQLIQRFDPQQASLAVLRAEGRKDSRTVAATCVLESTWVSGAAGGLTYRCVEAGVASASLRVHESVQAAQFSFGPGFTRTWRVEPLSTRERGGAIGARVRVGDAHAQAWSKWQRAGGVYWVYTAQLGEDGVEAVVLRNSPQHQQLDSLPSLDIWVTGELSATTVRAAKWSDELGLQMIKELGL